MRDISELSVAELIEIAQQSPHDNPQLAKERRINDGFIQLKSIKNGDDKPLFSHETIILILAKVYFLKESTITHIIYGNYEKIRERKKKREKAK
jgi:hypothetical protein